MAIPVDALPDDSPYITMAYDVALEIVNVQIAAVSAMLYDLGVYNLAGDNLLNYAQDKDGAPPVEGSAPPAAYFANARNKFNLTGFVPGVIQSAGDEGTNSSYVVQEAAKQFTLSDLQHLKTPYGRQYLGIAQRAGTVWGLT
jgi:hypothetical protein